MVETIVRVAKGDIDLDELLDQINEVNDKYSLSLTTNSPNIQKEDDYLTEFEMPIKTQN